MFPLQSEKRDSCDNGRGTILRLEKHVVTIEKKLAEGISFFFLFCMSWFQLDGKNVSCVIFLHISLFQVDLPLCISFLTRRIDNSH